MALLTDARLGLWQAIDNWPALKVNPGDTTATVFKKTFRFDQDAPAQKELAPTLSQLPCLALVTVGVKPDWINNRQQAWSIDYELRLWTRYWVLTEAEQLFEEVMNALYRAKSGNVEYVRQATGYPVMAYPEMQMAPIETEESNKAMLTTWKVGLRTTKDPFGS